MGEHVYRFRPAETHLQMREEFELYKAGRPASGAIVTQQVQQIFKDAAEAGYQVWPSPRDHDTQRSNPFALTRWIRDLHVGRLFPIYLEIWDLRREFAGRPNFPENCPVNISPWAQIKTKDDHVVDIKSHLSDNDTLLSIENFFLKAFHGVEGVAKDSASD